jgi:hypothetical protein
METPRTTGVSHIVGVQSCKPILLVVPDGKIRTDVAPDIPGVFFLPSYLHKMGENQSG